MLSQKEISKKMSNDIDEMEKMLNDYLEFSKTQSHEETVKIDITKLLEKIEFNINNKNLTIKKDNINFY